MSQMPAAANRRSSVASQAASAVKRLRSSGGMPCSRARAGEHISGWQFGARKPILHGMLKPGELGEEQEIGLQIMIMRQRPQPLSALRKQDARVGKTHE